MKRDKPGKGLAEFPSLGKAAAAPDNALKYVAKRKGQSGRSTSFSKLKKKAGSHHTIVDNLHL